MHSGEISSCRLVGHRSLSTARCAVVQCRSGWVLLSLSSLWSVEVKSILSVDSSLNNSDWGTERGPILRDGQVLLVPQPRLACDNSNKYGSMLVWLNQELSLSPSLPTLQHRRCQFQVTVPHLITHITRHDVHVVDCKATVS